MVNRKSNITAIPNRYKGTHDNLIDNSDTGSLDRLKPIDKESCNTLKPKGVLIEAKSELERDFLNKNRRD